MLATRGEFSEGALRLKAVKKKVFIAAVKQLRLYNGLTWHASSTHEVADIRRVMSVGKATPGSIVVAPNLAGSISNQDLKHDLIAGRRYGRKLRVCFLSRISPMKNLDFALRMLMQVNAPVKFVIYGPVEDSNYWAECQAQIEKLPSNIEVAYEGLVKHAQVVSTLAQNDLFLLPTRGENSGHVIHEALRAGLPTLISDQTPWRKLAEKGVGWDLPLDDVDQFVKRIEEVAAWSDREYQRWSSRAIAHAAKVAEDPAIVESNRRLFLDAIGGSEHAAAS